MITIQLTLEEPLLSQIDQVTRTLDMTRAAFVRLALEWALRNQKIIALEQQHAQGYERQPETANEISEWQSEQVWSEA